MQPTLIRRCFVEFIATFALILAIGFAVVRGISPLYIAATTLMLMISFYGHISGCHINPSVTLGLAFSKKFSWLDVVPYWLSQILGAAFAVLCVQKTLDPSISTKFCEILQIPTVSGENSSLSLINLITLQPFLLGTLGTFLFVSLILNVVTSKFIPPILKGVGIGLSLVLVSVLFGPSIFLSVNPARTLGPVLFQFKEYSAHETNFYLRDALIITFASLIGGALAGIVRSIAHKEES